MPLPLIPIIIGVAAAGTGLFGIGKGIKAVVDNNESGDINSRSKKIIEDVKNSLQEARNASKEALENLGKEKIRISDLTLGRFIKLFEQVKNIEFNSSKGLDELAKFKIDKETFSEIKNMNMILTSFVGGTISGTIAGGALAFGAYGTAGTFAAASTGTTIVSLSGAAATKATLAFFGGGSLAAGGLGIAGGTMVLGSLVAGPALAIMGIVMGTKASANLDNAYSNLSKAKAAAEEIKTLIKTCNAVRRRTYLFARLVIRLDLLMHPLLEQFEKIINVEGVDYKKYSNDSQSCVAAILSTVQAIKAILDTPILEESGALSDESLQIAQIVQHKLES